MTDVRFIFVFVFLEKSAISAHRLHWFFLQWVLFLVFQVCCVNRPICGENCPISGWRESIESCCTLSKPLLGIFLSQGLGVATLGAREQEMLSGLFEIKPPPGSGASCFLLALSSAAFCAKSSGPFLVSLLEVSLSFSFIQDKNPTIS